MFAKRTLACYCGAFSLGIAAGVLSLHIEPGYIIAAVILIALFTATFFFFGKKTHKLPAAFLVGLLVCLFYNLIFVYPSIRMSGTTAELEVYVAEVNDNTLTLVPYSEAPPGTKLEVTIGDELLSTAPDISVGDSFYAVISFGSVDAYNSFSNGITLNGVVTELKHSESKAPWLKTVLFNVRAYAAGLFEENIKGDEAFLASALTLGNRDRLPQQITGDFRQAGLSHMLALSGLHFSAVIAIIWWLLGFAPIGKKPKCIIAALCVLGYLALVGATPSVARASVFALVFIASKAFRRTSDSITSLMLALAVILIAAPYSICALSLQLTFLGTAGVIYGLERTAGLNSSEKYATPGGRLFVRVSRLIAISFYASAFVLPVTVFSFGTANILSPLSNLIAALPCCAAISMNFIFLLTGFVFPGAAGLVGLLAMYPNKLLLMTAQLLGSLGVFSLEVSSAATLVCVCLLAFSEIYIVVAVSDKNQSISRRVFIICIIAVLICVLSESFKR